MLRHVVIQDVDYTFKLLYMKFVSILSTGMSYYAPAPLGGDGAGALSGDRRLSSV